MKLISDLISGILRGAIKLALLALTVMFVLFLLVTGLMLLLAHLIRFLLTGRKPAVFATYARFNQAAQQFRPGSWTNSAAGARPDSADIVDVQAHEVHAALPPLPHSNIEKFR